MTATLTHLERLEAEAIHIIREAVTLARNPVLLFSVGKDSAVLLHLTRKACAPAAPPLPLLHIDTTWKFQEMYAARQAMAEAASMDLLVWHNPEGLARGINPFDHGALHTRLWKTEGLKQALDHHGFDVALGGARRDEDRSRAKERIVSVRSPGHGWDPRQQRPELWSLYNLRMAPGETLRVFPLSNWTELDIWTYIAAERIAVPSLYLAALRPTYVWQGQLFMADDVDRLSQVLGQCPPISQRWVRFRTLGCFPLSAAVESEAATLEQVIAETAGARASERFGRVIDREEGGTSLEAKKREGYF
jgi:sulfate adenylyltransferase subunit 2